MHNTHSHSNTYFAYAQPYTLFTHMHKQPHTVTYSAQTQPHGACAISFGYFTDEETEAE